MALQLVSCDSATGWSIVSGANDGAVLSAYTTNKQEGTASIDITTPSHTNGQTLLAYALGQSTDLSGWSYLTLWTFLTTKTDLNPALHKLPAVWLYDSSGNYKYYNPIKYEGAYETDSDVYYVGWHFKMYQLDSPTGWSATPGNLADITTIRLVWNYPTTYAASRFRVDDIRVRGNSLTSETSGVWTPPHLNQVYGIHSILTDGANPYMRVWNTLCTTPNGTGRAICSYYTPTNFELICRVRLNNANSRARIFFDYIDEDNFGCAYINYSSTLADYSIGVEQYVSGVRYYSQTTWAATLATWYELRLNVRDLFVNLWRDETKVVTNYQLQSRLNGQAGLGTADADFGTTPNTISADFDTVSAIQLLVIDGSKHYWRIRAKDADGNISPWSPYNQGEEEDNDYFSLGYSGLGAPSIPLPTVSGTGALTLKGTGALSIPLPSVSGSAERVITGTGALSIPMFTASGSGDRGPTTTSASLSIPLPTISGVGTSYKGGATLVADGSKHYWRMRVKFSEDSVSDWSPYDQVEEDDNNFWVFSIDGTGHIILPLPTVSSEGGQSLGGVGDLSIPIPEVSGSGSRTSTGTGSIEIPLPGVASSGVRTVVGSGALTIPLPTVSSSGEVVFTGTGDISLPMPVVEGAGVRTSTGSGTPAIPLPTVAGAGAHTIKGTGAITIPLPTMAGTAPLVWTGSGALTIPMFRTSGLGVGYGGTVDIIRRLRNIEDLLLVIFATKT